MKDSEVISQSLTVPWLNGSIGIFQPQDIGSPTISFGTLIGTTAPTDGFNYRLVASSNMNATPSVRTPVKAGRNSFRANTLGNITWNFEISNSLIFVLALLQGGEQPNFGRDSFLDVEILKTRTYLDELLSRYNPDEFDDAAWKRLFNELLENNPRVEEGFLSWLSQTRRHKSFVVDLLENLPLFSEIKRDSLSRIIASGFRSSNPNVRYGAALAFCGLPLEEIVSDLQRAISLEKVMSVRDTLVMAWKKSRN